MAQQPDMINYPNTHGAVSPEKCSHFDGYGGNQGSAQIGHEGFRNKTVAFL